MELKAVFFIESLFWSCASSNLSSLTSHPISRQIQHSIVIYTNVTWVIMSLRVDCSNTLDSLSELNKWTVTVFEVFVSDAFFYFAVVNRHWARVKFISWLIRHLCFLVHLAAVETGLLAPEWNWLLDVGIWKKVSHFFFLFPESISQT